MDVEILRATCEEGFRRDIWFLVADAAQNFTDVPCIDETAFHASLIVFMLMKVLMILICLVAIFYNDDNVARLYLLGALLLQVVELTILIGTYVDPLEFSFNSENPALPMLFAVYMFMVFLIGIVLSYKIKILTQGLAPRFLAQSKGFRLASSQTRLQSAVLVAVVVLAFVFCSLLAAIPFSNRYQGVPWQETGDLMQQDFLFFLARCIHVVTLMFFTTVPFLHMYSLWQFMQKQRKLSASDASGSSAAKSFEHKLRFGLVAMTIGIVPGGAMSILASDKSLLGPTAYLVLLEFAIGYSLALMILYYFFPFFSFSYCRDDYIRREAGSTTREGSLTIHNI